MVDNHAGSVQPVWPPRGRDQLSISHLPEASFVIFRGSPDCVLKVSEPHRLAERSVSSFLAPILDGRGRERGREWSTGCTAPGVICMAPGLAPGCTCEVGLWREGAGGDGTRPVGWGPSLQRLPAPSHSVKEGPDGAKSYTRWGRLCLSLDCPWHPLQVALTINRRLCVMGHLRWIRG